ncbi:hypothetical protein PsorP6_012009 [Peronosclerospora sorghi]|uniref:Uncharacterized protein n=1 Tax=Peronosclerospora sorghi TaxID=230839 RepID=A0ACC0WIE1_9STRA|nr:hypothetical protein PsorP6_012009 [Peronosclerospora sorghi]
MSSNAVAELQAATIDQFLVGTHPKVRGQQLQLLIRCHLSEAVEDTHTLRLQLQIPLTRVISVSADAHVLAPGLELFALMVSDQPFDQETEIALYQTLCHEIEMRSDESNYGAATLSKKLIQHIDVSSVLTACAAATDAKIQDRGNLDLSRCIFEPKKNKVKVSTYYLANMLDDRGVLMEDVEGAKKFMTLLYYRLFAEDPAISTTELQHGDRS